MLLLLAASGCDASWTRLPDDSARLDTAETGDPTETAVETGDSGVETGDSAVDTHDSPPDTDTGDPPSPDDDADGWSVDEGDCDDTNPLVNPGMTETCDDADLDEDCDGLADDADSDASGKIVTFPDGDGDGYAADDAVSTSVCDGPIVTTTGDCDDSDPAVYPGAPDAAGGDGLDDDCDGFIDEDGLGDGDLLVSEMYWRGDDVIDYSTYQASGPQWIEIVNRRADSVSLLGWQLRLCLVTGASVTAPPEAADCEATTETVHTFDDVRLGPDERLVVCSEAFDGCDVEIALVEAMSIRNGWLELSHEGTRMDQLAWWYVSSSDYWPSSTARSMRMDDVELAAATGEADNDEYGEDRSTWCYADTTVTWDRASGTAYGTPGDTNGSCP